MPVVCGIDPGKQGAIAFLDSRDQTARTYRMPLIKTDKKAICLSTVADVLQAKAPTLVGVEKVHAMPKQGVVSMFSFGVSFGGILGCCAALKLPVVLVTPQSWKQQILAGYDRSDKRSSVLFCASYFTRVLLDDKPVSASSLPDGVADALCIALYVQRVSKGS